MNQPLKTRLSCCLFNPVSLRPFKLLSILVVFIVFSLSSQVVLGLELKYGGEVRYRAFYTDNLSDSHNKGGEGCRGSDGMLGTEDDTCNDEETFSDVRFRLKLSASEGIATGVLVVDFLSQEGRHVATLTPSRTVQTGNWRLGSGGWGGSLDTIFVREAYLHGSIPWFRAVVGRQPIKLGHGLVLDDTMDALVGNFPLGPVSLTIAGVKLIELDQVDGARDHSDTDVYFTHFAWVPASDIETSLFFIHLRDRGPGLNFKGFCGDPNAVAPTFQTCDLSDDLGGDRMLLYALGWTLDTMFNRFHLGLETDYLTGRLETNGDDIQLRGFNGLVQMGFILPVVEVGLTGVYASGQEEEELPITAGDKLNINAISPNFVLGNILVNNETISDRAGGDIGGLTAVKLTFERPLWLGVEGELAVIWARLTEPPSSDFDPDLGWEVDFNSTYLFDDHLTWISGVGFLFPGEGWQWFVGDEGAEDTQIKLTTIFSYTF